MSASPSETSPLTDRPIGRRRSDRIAGASSSLQRAVEQAAIAARSDRPVLIWGPDGSGRRHLARAVHAWSGRSGGPMVTFAADGIPEILHSRELFGASPGGEPLLGGGHAGAIERAAEGTLLVCELERLSTSAREALAQALKNGQFLREGETQAVPLASRVVLTSRTAESGLVGDLPVHTVELTRLADRPEDVLPLAVHFLALFAAEEGLEPVGFTPEARQNLLQERWAGNVRELRERVRQAVRLGGDGAISVEALALSVDGEEIPSFKEAKRGFEARYVRGLLRRCGGNISRAARLAKKDRKDFYDVIRRTGIDPQEFRG